MAKRLFKLITNLIAYISLLFGATYISLYIAVYAIGATAGIYSPVFDIYVCKSAYVCFHEQGHSYDAHGAPFTFLRDQWRSTGEEFRADVNIINKCMLDFLNNNGDPQQRNLSDFRVFSTIHWIMAQYNGNDRYREIYAELYAIVKFFQWDTDRFSGVEDAVAQGVDICREIQADIEMLARQHD